MGNTHTGKPDHVVTSVKPVLKGHIDHVVTSVKPVLKGHIFLALS